MTSGDPQRARLLRVLATFFALLALPTGAVIWQAFDQLKFESFFQYRNQAEALSSRIDARLARISRDADARGFADYSFLNVTDPANSSLLQRSPLAAYPVSDTAPGVIGYFQIDADGRFSTPLLPDEELLGAVGIDTEEYRERLALAENLRRILADNRLVTAQRTADSLDLVTSPLTESPSPSVATGGERVAETEGDAAKARNDAAYTRQSFDELLSQQRQKLSSGSLRDDAAAGGNLYETLEVDEDLETKSVAAEQRQAQLAAESAAPVARVRRTERAALPQPLEESPSSEADAVSPIQRVLTFESEIDPYYFRALDSGHFVMFRNVWREDERYVQGVLIDQPEFVADVVAAEYGNAALASVATLEVGYYGDALTELPTNGAQPYDYRRSADALRGTHLFSRQLSAPFDGLTLTFAVQSLPLGPGARVLGWSTVAVAAVFVLGFVALYRLGIGQIRLAQQRQDFVSAVSHELKTPLTSIRMYGEMLNEGWVDDTRRKRYYRFIHEESERLTRLISNVLRLAKISRDDRDLDVSPVSVAEIIESIQSKVSQQAERAGFELRTNVSEAVAELHVAIDKDALLQVFINLVDNAVKFAQQSDRKTIDLAVAATGDKSLLLSVRDYGPGIPESQLKRIFTLFYRSESELTRETVGTGIGLAIVHELVSAMGGKVDVVNANPGAEFRVFLPQQGADGGKHGST